MKHNITIHSDSSSLTQKIGENLASQLASSKIQKAVILLKGDLGSGKTTFVKGFLKYFGIKPLAASPTFVIMKRYIPRKPLATRYMLPAIYHMDAYRLKSAKDLDVFDFKEIEREDANYILIEWPEQLKGKKFPGAIQISFTHGKKENERVIKIK
jgi:tRNA threonylcarbamoyladenosine biosynthesis protein TsaE